MDRLIWTTGAFVFLALCLPALAMSSGLDAFVLAVQHFDPRHETGVEYESDEVAYMRQVLWEARQSVPEVAGLHVQVDGSVESKFGPSMFRSIRVKPQNYRVARFDRDIDLLKEFGESIGVGCRHEEQVNKKYHSNRNASTTRIIQWNLGRDCLGGNHESICENSSVVEWLCSLGVDSVTLKEHEFMGNRRAELFLNYKYLVDLEYKVMRIANDPRYASVFGDLKLDPFGGTAIGGGPTLRVVSVNELSGFRGVRVEFSAGWGDCPAGCIYRHNWLFEYKTVGERRGDEWTLAGGLIEENGDPLTEQIRGMLRCAKVVR